jgi:hypothetical protein
MTTPKVKQRAMLDGPVLPTLLKLALPTVVVLVVQTLFGVAETSSAFSARRPLPGSAWCFRSSC